MFASVCPMKRPHSPEMAPFETLAAVCCAAMKPDRTLTEVMVNRKVRAAIKISRNLLCCRSMLAMQLRPAAASSQQATPMQIPRSTLGKVC